ncbi:hypothetical protein L0244_31315 [bacterium]|nr:hypothetical protein [bacterium]
MADDIVIQILRNLQNGQSEIKYNLDSLRSDMNLQLPALNEKFSGQMLSEIEIRKELSELRERLQRVEKRLDLVD